MRNLPLPRLLCRARLACLLAGALSVSGVVGCCMPCRPCGAGPVCGPEGHVVRARAVHARPRHAEYREYVAARPAPPPADEQWAAGQNCEPAHGAHRKPVHRLAHHLKPDGPLQPQVPVPPLPKFHPLPVKPVFEPNYFDTVVGPAEAPPYLGPVPARDF